jgi:hypothetical protein
MDSVRPLTANESIAFGEPSPASTVESSIGGAGSFVSEFMPTFRDSGRWRTGRNLAVDPLDLGHQRIRRIVGSALAASFAHAGALFRIPEQLRDACPQSLNVAWWYEDTSDPVPY